MGVRTDASRSAALYDRAIRVLPGGVSRNTVLRTPHPVYADHGAGCRLIDLDDVERIDFANNMASLIHGHAYPEIVEAVTDQLSRGTAFMMATESEVRYAEHLCGRNPDFEKIRFTNSGTEAIMVALKASRAYTGRPKIAKVEGAYHGGYDYAEVSQAPEPSTWGDADSPQSVPLAHGTPGAALADVVIIPFNDPDRATSILDRHKDEIACVLMDLMPHRVGLKPADAGFVSTIRNWTSTHGALLVLDEVITFRTEVGGLQSRYDITPDLTALGKMIGGGFPVGAVVGRSAVMNTMNPRAERLLFPHSGTFSANPMTMTAGLIAMENFDEQAVTRLNTLNDRAMKGISDAIGASGVRACVTGSGSMFRVHMKESAPRNYREAFLDPEEKRRLQVLLDHLFEEGFLMINTCSGTLSTPMTEVEIDALVTAFATGFRKIAETN
ncbi:MAG: aspartate aminotransferase family protein [Planctomycetota bacterium]